MNHEVDFYEDILILLQSLYLPHGFGASLILLQSIKYNPSFCLCREEIVRMPVF